MAVTDLLRRKKSKLNKIGQSGRFLGQHLGPLLKSGLPLVGNVFRPLAKTVIIPLGLETHQH